MGGFILQEGTSDMGRLTAFFTAYESNLHRTRYADGDESSWTDTFRRVAETVGDGDEALVSDFLDMMDTGLVIPSSPQLWNYGSSSKRHPRNGSSCFTLRMGDTLTNFRQADAEAEAVYVASGGAGVLLNEVRPRGCKIRHCSEGAMGSMCSGGPAPRLEGTTGYITGSGRARGALMLQLSAWHPDAVEFIVAKLPISLGFLDDWRANAWAVLGWNQEGTKRHIGVQYAIERICSHWVNFKEWPMYGIFVQDLIDHGFDGENALKLMEESGIVSMPATGKIDKIDMQVVPMVTDWSTMTTREANRDWHLPLQNCNMSIRIPDELMNAAENDEPWVLHWFDSDPPKQGETTWTKTDALTPGVMTEYDDRYFGVVDGMTAVEHDRHDVPGGGAEYRYGVVITTWEGLRANMEPNQNMWRDTDYARFYRKAVIPSTDRYTGQIMARDLLDLIYRMAHSHADPGVVFETTYERFQPVDSEVYGPRLSNPCSEYVNSAGGSCDLASGNLRLCAERAVDLNKLPTLKTTVKDFINLSTTDQYKKYLFEVHDAAVRALVYISHSMEYNVAPVPYIHELSKYDYRTVGVGMMGLAEAMMMFGIQYGTPAAESFAAHTMAVINLACWEKSFDLASDGWTKPKGWDAQRMWGIFNERYMAATRYRLPKGIASRYRHLQRRVLNGENATHTCVTSVAPTGTISMIASWTMMRHASNGVIVDRIVTSGCEPPFAWSVHRQDNSGSCVINHDLWNGPMRGQPWMVTSSQVTPSEHIKIQGAVAAFTCMSVSKTVNMDAGSSVEDIGDAYRLAWKLGIPGTAVYRDTSKPMQVLSALDCPSGECAASLPVESGVADAVSPV